MQVGKQGGRGSGGPGVSRPAQGVCCAGPPQVEQVWGVPGRLQGAPASVPAHLSAHLHPARPLRGPWQSFHQPLRKLWSRWAGAALPAPLFLASHTLSEDILEP